MIGLKKLLLQIFILCLLLFCTRCRSLNESTPDASDSMGKIAYTSESGALAEIYIMDSDGSHKINLTNTPARNRNPAFSPDGSRIAFTSNRVNLEDIYVMDAEGDNQVKLTNAYATTERYPVFSPDGSRICYVAYYQSWDICLADPDSAGITRLTDSPGIDDWDPEFSPNGTQIAFVSYQSGSWDIYTIDADGQNQKQLTFNYHTWDKTYAPDGSKIYFTAYTPEHIDIGRQIYVINSDGGEITRLTSFEKSAAAPCVSPDGSRIAFSLGVTIQESTFSEPEIVSDEIFIMNSDGTNIKRLTDNLNDDISPLFTTDGLHILYLSDRLGNHDIWRVDASGGGNLKLTDSVADDHSPVCQPL